MFSPENRPVVALAASVAGDVNALRSDMEQGPALARYVGICVGEAIAAAVREAVSAASDFTVEIRYAEPSVNDRLVDGQGDTELAEQWSLGAPTLGGSEEGRSLLHHASLVYEGMTGNYFPQSNSQYPKAPALAVLRAFIVEYLYELEPTPVFPMHALKLGSHVFVTVPAEPTTMAAYRIEQKIKASTGASGATVLGYAGECSGCYTTEEEYCAQHYEGSSMLFGQNASRRIGARLEKLVAHSEPLAIDYRPVEFGTGIKVNDFSDKSEGGAVRETELIVTRKDLHVEVRWRTPINFRVIFA